MKTVQQLPEVTDEIRIQAAKNLDITIMPSGFLYWHGTNQLFLDEEQRQIMFNTECNKILTTAR